MNRIPSLTGRKFSTHFPALDKALDEIYSALQWVVGRKDHTVGITDMVLNDGTGGVERGLVYGRDASGRISLAAAGTVAPIWLAESTVAPGAQFHARVIGSSRVRLYGSPPTAAGSLVWLSFTAAGSVQVTAPANYRFMCGRFSETTTDEQGLIGIDTFIFPQGGQTL